MKMIAVMSPKGGIGKTTTADTIAYILGEEYERRVLVIDGDPQGDTSKTFGRYEPEGIGMSELLERHKCVGGDYHTSELIQTTKYSHIDIIPANGYLMRTDMNLMLKQEENQITRLRDALEEVSGAYDYCICDCGRLLDMVVINILIASDIVIAPVKVGGYENEALHNLEEQIENLRSFNSKLRIKGIMTMRQKNKTSLEFETWLREASGFDMFVTPVRRSIVVEKATIGMTVLPKFSTNGIVTRDYRSIVTELLEEIEIVGEVVGRCEIDKDGKIVMLERKWFRQGYIYKNPNAYYNNKSAVCYVPEMSNSIYTGKDFLDMCNGQTEIADHVFDAVDWQHPESYLDEQGDEDLCVCKCGKWYWSYGTDKCPYCGEGGRHERR